MCLRFVFLLITRVASWLRLSRREQAWQTAQILILRHQLAVVQRRQPRRPNLNWADRALLAALPGVTPQARRPGLRLLGRQVPARQQRPAGGPPHHQGPGPAAGPREPRMGVPQDPRRAGRPGSEDSGAGGVGHF